MKGMFAGGGLPAPAQPLPREISLEELRAIPPKAPPSPYPPAPAATAPPFDAGAFSRQMQTVLSAVPQRSSSEFALAHDAPKTGRTEDRRPQAGVRAGSPASDLARSRPASVSVPARVAPVPPSPCPRAQRSGSEEA